jgi:uncharacterized protein RhaS with RHS repeats
MYYRARYYHPGLARFMSEDPIGPVDSANLFLYVRGSPIQWNDPTGRVTEVPYVGAAADAAFGEFAEMIHHAGMRAWGVGAAFGLGYAAGSAFNWWYNTDSRSVGTDIHEWWNDSTGTPQWERPNPNPWKR